MSGRRRGGRWSALLQRPHLRNGELVVAALAVASIAITQVLAVTKVVPLSDGQTLTLTGVGAVVASVAVVLKVRASRRHQRMEEEAALALPPASIRSHSFQKVADVSPYDIGVSLSKYVEANSVPPPYIPRDLDPTVDAALRERSLVLLVGASKAGKSRTAFEAVRRVYPERGLVVPNEAPGALARLFDDDALLRRTRRPLLLWLDDLDRYLGPGGLDLALLDKLAQAKVVTMATITARRRAEVFETANDKRRMLESIQARACEIWLESLPSEAELRAAAKLYPAEDCSRGIGERLVAGRALLQRYRDGVDRSSLGRALVEAVVDWQRAGVTRPITKTELYRLGRSYLERRRSNYDMNEATMASACAWACEPIASHVALLTMTEVGGTVSFVAFDYLVEQIDQGFDSSRSGIPDETWMFVLDQAGLDQLTVVGTSARARGRRDVAEAAWRRAATAETPAVAARAMLTLGLLLRDQGDTEAAKNLLRRVGDLEGHPYQQAPAIMALSDLLVRDGDLDGASSVLKGANTSTLAHALPAFLVRISSVLVKLGDAEGARETGRKAVDMASGTRRPMILNSLGDVLRALDDAAGAEVIYREVIASGDRNEAPMAMFLLGELFKEQGNGEAAEYWLRCAIDSEEKDAAPSAKGVLAELLEERGDWPAAEALYQELRRCGHPVFAPYSDLWIGGLREKRGDTDGAKAAYRAAVTCGHPPFEIDALRALTELLVKDGEIQGAKSVHMKLIETGSSSTAAMAMLELGSLLAKHGQIEEARSIYERAIATGHATVAPKALNALGVLLHKRDPTAARAAYERAASSGHATVAPTAATNLGLLLETMRDTPGAVAAYRSALAKGAHGPNREKAERQLRRLVGIESKPAHVRDVPQ